MTGGGQDRPPRARDGKMAAVVTVATGTTAATGTETETGNGLGLGTRTASRGTVDGRMASRLLRILTDTGPAGANGARPGQAGATGGPGRRTRTLARLNARRGQPRRP
ncbi:hypothetical protein MAPG_06842 [Magnaporthiopsis poae ATCC 64411]|uniref:Uncharacterized protein n=1 Tax=Magnaporthiopsis poae (strain ATCC 64411 / 73-15) TaxID=644358 RepID=A0A0C4E350_MAGP6|nr:hypothetical protein MAPG_06842 [Magnaporthiopsis poae ATCC 64411]